MMIIDERIRHELHQRLDDILGVDQAAALMSHLPPAGWSDVVTRTHLDHVLEVRFAHVDARFDQMAGTVDSRFAHVDARFDQMAGTVDSRFAEVDARFDRLEERFDERLATAEHRIIAAMRGEFITAMAQQTRTMIFALIGAIVSISLLAFSLATVT